MPAAPASVARVDPHAARVRSCPIDKPSVTFTPTAAEVLIDDPAVPPAQWQHVQIVRKMALPGRIALVPGRHRFSGQPPLVSAVEPEFILRKSFRGHGVRRAGTSFIARLGRTIWD